MPIRLDKVTDKQTYLVQGIQTVSLSANHFAAASL